MKELKIEYIDINELKEYKQNAKLHPDEQIEQIKLSIEKFGFNDPIALDKNNVIIEGHGRLLAAKKLKMEKLPIIRLDHLNENQKRSYILAHNKLTMSTGFDFNLLKEEVDHIFENDSDGVIPGFTTSELEDILDGIDTDEEIEGINNKYTMKVDVPQYQPTGENIQLEQTYNRGKMDLFILKINESKVSKPQKEFLRLAATRFIEFNYHNIADYYTSVDKDMQELMEMLLLVIIDFNDAIKDGYVKLTKGINLLSQEDEKHVKE